eukprot:15365497-Ditylum_brightwellii.AAC.1
MERGTYQRTQQIRAEYALKPQTCNSQLSQDAPEDQHRFEEALKKFTMGRPIPLVFGAFGKVNKESLTFLKATTLAAASTEEGFVMSPVRSMHDQQGVYNLIIHKFRLAISTAAPMPPPLHKTKQASSCPSSKTLYEEPYLVFKWCLILVLKQRAAPV